MVRTTYLAAIVLALGLGTSDPSARAADIGSDALSFVLLSTGGEINMDRDSQAGLGGNGSNLGAVGGTSALLEKDSQIGERHRHQPWGNRPEEKGGGVWLHHRWGSRETC